MQGIQEDETILGHWARKQTPVAQTIPWRKMRQGKNECAVGPEIIRWFAMHKSNGIGRIQVKPRAYHKFREDVERALNIGLTGLAESDIPMFSSKDTAARNDRLFHIHMRQWLEELLDGVLNFVAWDEGSTNNVCAVIAYLTHFLKGEPLSTWQTKYGDIEEMVYAKRKSGKGKAGKEPVGVEGGAKSEEMGDGEMLRSLLGIRYAKNKKGAAVADCIKEMLDRCVGSEREQSVLEWLGTEQDVRFRRLRIKMIYFALVDGASTNLGKNIGSVQKLRKSLDSILISAVSAIWLSRVAITNSAIFMFACSDSLFVPHKCMRSPEGNVGGVWPK